MYGGKCLGEITKIQNLLKAERIGNYGDPWTQCPEGIQHIEEHISDSAMQARMDQQICGKKNKQCLADFFSSDHQFIFNQ